jgi:hypothetical protein
MGITMTLVSSIFASACGSKAKGGSGAGGGGGGGVTTGGSVADCGPACDKLLQCMTQGIDNTCKQNCEKNPGMYAAAATCVKNAADCDKADACLSNPTGGATGGSTGSGAQCPDAGTACSPTASKCCGAYPICCTTINPPACTDMSTCPAG